MSFILKTALLLSNFIPILNATEFSSKITEECSLIFQPNTFIPKENLKINAVAQIEPLLGSGRDEIGRDYNKTIYTFTLANDLIRERTVELELSHTTYLKIRASDKPFLSTPHHTHYHSDKTVSFYTFYNSLNWQKEVGYVHNKRKDSSVAEGEVLPRFKHEVTLTDEQNLEVKILLTKLKI